MEITEQTPLRSLIVDIQTVDKFVAGREYPGAERATLYALATSLRYLKEKYPPDTLLRDLDIDVLLSEWKL